MLLPTVQETGEMESTNLQVEIPAELAGVFNIADNMEGVVPRLPQIKVLHTAQLFEMPDESKAETFEGVILDQHPANAWWETDISETGGGAVPDCFSMDGITPDLTQEKVQSQKCADCKQNQFGSERKGTGGKDCKNMKRLHILMEGSLLPRRVTVAPTSIRSFDGYMTGLVDRGLPYACVVTVFSLIKKEASGFVFAEAKFIKDRVLKPEELQVVAKFIKQYKDPARSQQIQSDEYMNGDNSTPVEDDIPF